MKIPLIYIGIAVIALILMRTGWRMFEHYSLFRPGRTLVGNPADSGLEFEEVWFQASDGVKLHGWFVPAEVQGPVVLLFHGNAGNISHRVDYVADFHRAGFPVFIFDYRGYGSSEGRPSEKGLYLDAEAALVAVTETAGVPEEEIVLFGRSLGATVAAELATKHACRALVMESPFISIPVMGNRMYPLLPRRLLEGVLRHKFDTLEKVERSRCGVFVIHGAQDYLVPYDHGRVIFEAAPEPRDFYLVAEGRHNDVPFVACEEYYQRVWDFIESAQPRLKASS